MSIKNFVCKCGNPADNHCKKDPKMCSLCCWNPSFVFSVCHHSDECKCGKLLDRECDRDEKMCTDCCIKLCQNWDEKCSIHRKFKCECGDVANKECTREEKKCDKCCIDKNDTPFSCFFGVHKDKEEKSELENDDINEEVENSEEKSELENDDITEEVENSEEKSKLENDDITEEVENSEESKTKNNELEKELIELQKKFNELEKKNENFKDELEKKDELKNELITLKKENSRLEKENEKVNNDLEKIRSIQSGIFWANINSLFAAVDTLSILECPTCTICCDHNVEFIMSCCRKAGLCSNCKTEFDKTEKTCYFCRGECPVVLDLKSIKDLGIKKNISQ